MPHPEQWQLTTVERKKLGDILEVIPREARFTFHIWPRPGSSQAITYAADIFALFGEKGWPVFLYDPSVMLAPKNSGLEIVVAPSTTFASSNNESARRLQKILETSGISFTRGTDVRLSEGQMGLVVGGRPAK
jgi:hypothetical protein